MDAVLVANEGVDDLIGSNKNGMLCKLDIEEAYDHVCLDFVDYMLDRLGFGGRWRSWIRTCITTASFTVMIMKVHLPFYRLLGGLGTVIPYPYSSSLWLWMLSTGC